MEGVRGVRVVTEMLLLPALDGEVKNLETNGLDRKKREYQPDKGVKIDSIGQPRGVPSRYLFLIETMIDCYGSGSGKRTDSFPVYFLLCVHCLVL